MTTTYFYSLVTFTPHPLRGERIDLGVVLVSEEGHSFDSRFTNSYRDKLRALAPDVHPNAIKGFVSDFRTRFGSASLGASATDHLAPTVDTLGQLADRYGGQVQFTAPRAHVTTDAIEAARDDLFRAYVGPIRSPRAAPVGRTEVRHRVRQVLRRWSVPDAQVAEAPQLLGTHGLTLDLGVVDDGRVVVAIEPISFRVGTALEIVRQRDHVAWVRTDLAGTNDPTICAVVTSPAPAHRDLYRQSEELFSELDVKMIDSQDIDPLRDVLVDRGITHQSSLIST